MEPRRGTTENEGRRQTSPASLAALQNPKLADGILVLASRAHTASSGMNSPAGYGLYFPLRRVWRARFRAGTGTVDTQSVAGKSHAARYQHCGKLVPP